MKTVFDMPIADLKKNVAKVIQLLDEIEKLLPGLAILTEDDRKHSDGKLRAGEATALASVLDVAEHAPHYFMSLADKDGGRDPKKFETEYLRDQLERREILNALLEQIGQFSSPLTDTVLLLGERTRPVLLMAYRLSKSIAETDKTIRARLSRAIDFYGRIGKRGADTRAAKRSVASK